MERTHDTDLRPGDPVGEYHVVRKIGQGGMGTVYEGVHPVIGKRVAIKCLRGDVARDAGVIRRFVDEASAVNRIGNRHIVDIFGFGTLPDGRQYCVMELLHGHTLDAVIVERGALPFAEIMEIVAQVCKALTATHDAGIVHRDLKPANVFLCQDDDGPPFVRLLDFGIAKLQRGPSAGPGLTGTGVILGTPEYLSPERCRVDAVVDHRADLYALGVMLFEMLAGRPPFADPNAVVVAAKHLQEAPPPVSSFAPFRTVPPSLDRFVARTLAKEPAARPATARVFLEELRAAGLPITSERVLDLGRSNVFETSEVPFAALAAAGPSGAPAAGAARATGVAGPVPYRDTGALSVSTALEEIRPRRTWLLAGAAAIVGAGALTAIALRMASSPSASPSEGIAPPAVTARADRAATELETAAAATTPNTAPAPAAAPAAAITPAMHTESATAAGTAAGTDTGASPVGATGTDTGAPPVKTAGTDTAPAPAVAAAATDTASGTATDRTKKDRHPHAKRATTHRPVGARPTPAPRPGTAAPSSPKTASPGLKTPKWLGGSGG
ncbi:MAG TPA: serine/threonine-protein kinase [Myxococcota bacterium]|nr:serine/threonine-protein kinase [Myxococcota bacterium]